MFDPRIYIYGRRYFQLIHHDPCSDGSDDSCGWFLRARHGDKVTFDKIVSEFEFYWDKMYTFAETGETFPNGWFYPDGEPVFSPCAIALNMFSVAAWIHFRKNRRKTNRYLHKNLSSILHLAANPIDSMFPEIVGKFGFKEREERVRHFASIVYGEILRNTRQWWRHPRYHFWHYEVVVLGVSLPIHKLFGGQNRNGRSGNA